MTAIFFKPKPPPRIKLPRKESVDVLNSVSQSSLWWRLVSIFFSLFSLLFFFFFQVFEVWHHEISGYYASVDYIISLPCLWKQFYPCVKGVRGKEGVDSSFVSYRRYSVKRVRGYIYICSGLMDSSLVGGIFNYYERYLISERRR